MSSKSMTMINTITLVVIFATIILDESQAAVEPSYDEVSLAPSAYDDDVYVGCDSNLTTECKNQIVNAICEDLTIPMSQLVTDNCCEGLRANVTDGCYADVMANVEAVNLCAEKDLVEINSKAYEVGLYCIHGSEF